MSEQSLSTEATRPLFGRTELALSLLVLFAWSTSWIALRLQLGQVAPEISVVWRFVLAGLFMFGWCVVRGEKLSGFSTRDHLFFAVLGVTLFSLNFVLFYHAGLMLVSGMLSVVFALAAPGNVIMQSLALRRPVAWTVAAGSMLGVLGVAALFAPEIVRFGFGHVGGLLLAAAGTVVFCTGNFISAKIQGRGIPLAPATAWGMLYGAVLLAVVSALRGLSFEIEWNPAYLGALVYLALIASVVAFMSYLSLLRKIGPARAGYLTVLFPVFALMISAVYEGYEWSMWSLIGLACVALGNLLVLWRKA